MSIGNDIVWLKHARSGRFTQKEYYTKIFSPSEKMFFDTINFPKISFEKYVWLLWTIKESVYKFCKRTDADLFFNPTKIEVKKIASRHCERSEAIALTHNLRLNDKNNILRGENFQDNFWLDIEAVIDEKNIPLKSMVTSDFIFSCAYENPANIFWGIKKINHTDYKNQSAEVRDFLLNDLKNIYPDKNFSIEKDANGIPSLYDENGKKILISFTHHQCFVAYSFVE